MGVEPKVPRTIMLKKKSAKLELFAKKILIMVFHKSLYPNPEEPNHLITLEPQVVGSWSK